MKKISKALLIALLGLGAVGCETFPTGSNNTGSTVLSGDALILDELLARVVIPEHNTEIMNNFNLPATVNFENNVGQITWESDSGYVVIEKNKTTIEESGFSREVYKAIVVRPEAGTGNANVKLTATVSFNGKTATKTQKVTVVQSTAATEDSWGTFSAPIDTLKISTWKEWTEQDSGTIAVKGIITGYVYQTKYSDSNVFLQDANGGYYAYGVGDMSIDEAANYLAVGNEVIFEGEKSIFNGLHEFNQGKVNGIKVLSRGNVVAATDVTQAATEGKLTKYQSMYVKANGMFVSEEGKKYLQFGDNKYEIYHSEKYVGSYYNKVTEQLDALNPGDMVDVTGFIGCYNADQFHLTDIVKSATQVELTDEQKFGFAKDGVNTRFSKYTSETFDENTEIELYQYSDNTVSVTYALDSNADTSVFVLSNDKLTITPTAEEKTATLSATVKVGNFEETLTFEFKSQLPTGDQIKYEINSAMPSGLTYITNNPSYPDPAFYGDGGLKLNYENQAVETAKFEATDSVEVVFTINSINTNTKTAGSAENVFTVTGSDAEGNVVATAGYNDVVKGDNKVVLTADSATIVSVKITYSKYFNNGTNCCNLSLGGVTLNFGEISGETPENPGETPDNPTDPVESLTYTINSAMPSGLTYITNNPSYPNPAFYSDGGLKLNFENMGVSTANFTATDSVEVVFTINALNTNTKTAGTAENVFTITGLDAEGNVVTTAGYNDVVIGENKVTLTADSATIVSVKIVYTKYFNNGTNCCNISFGGVTLNF